MAGLIYVQDNPTGNLTAELNKLSDKLRNNCFFTASREWGDGDFIDWVAVTKNSMNLILSVSDYLTELSRKYPVADEISALTENFQLFLDTVSLASVSFGDLTKETLEELSRNISSLLGYVPGKKGLGETLHDLNVATHFDHADAPAFKCFTGFTELLDQLAATLEIHAIEEKNREKKRRDMEASALVNALNEYKDEYDALMTEVRSDEVYKGRSVHSLVIALPKMAEMIRELETSTIPKKKDSLTEISAFADLLRSELKTAEEAVEAEKEELGTKESDIVATIQKLNEAKALRADRREAVETMTACVNDIQAERQAELAQNGDTLAAARDRIPADLRHAYLVCEEANLLLADAPKLISENEMRTVYCKLHDLLEPKPDAKKGLFGKEKEIPGYVTADKALLKLEKTNPDQPMRDKLKSAFNDMRREVSLRIQALRVRDTSHAILDYEEELKKSGEADAFLQGKQEELSQLQLGLLDSEGELSRLENTLSDLSAAAEAARTRLEAKKYDLARTLAESKDKDAREQEAKDSLQKSEDHLAFLRENSRKVESLKIRYLKAVQDREEFVSGLGALKARTALTNFSSSREERIDLRADSYLARLEDRKGHHNDGPEYLAFCDCLAAVRSAEPLYKNSALLDLAKASVDYLNLKGSTPVPTLLQTRLRHVRLNLVNEVMNWALEASRGLGPEPIDALPGENELLLRAFDVSAELPDLTTQK